jgi:hypothetical protein
VFREAKKWYIDTTRGLFQNPVGAKPGSMKQALGKIGQARFFL